MIRVDKLSVDRNINVRCSCDAKKEKNNVVGYAKKKPLHYYAAIFTIAI